MPPVVYGVLRLGANNMIVKYYQWGREAKESLFHPRVGPARSWNQQGRVSQKNATRLHWIAASQMIETYFSVVFLRQENYRLTREWLWNLQLRGRFGLASLPLILRLFSFVMREHNLFFQTTNALILKDTANGDCVFLAFVFTLTGTLLLPLWYSSMSSACHWNITRCRRQVEFKATLSLCDRGVFGCYFSLPGRREALTKNTSIALGKPFSECGFASIWFCHADESFQGRNSCMRECSAVRMRVVSIPGACIVKC